MFKRNAYEEKNTTTAGGNKEQEKNAPAEEAPVSPSQTAAGSKSVNKILKGSKLVGDINVTCDLELSGDVEGNITSMQNSNILLKGACKGNIDTKEGSVVIEGEMSDGNITAGKDVEISGNFNGGEIKAGGKIFIDGEFNGKLEATDIEIGSNCRGKGEIFYKEFISISKGARVEVQISQTKQALKEVKPQSQTEATDTGPDDKGAENVS